MPPAIVIGDLALYADLAVGGAFAPGLQEPDALLLARVLHCPRHMSRRSGRARAWVARRRVPSRRWTASRWCGPPQLPAVPQGRGPGDPVDEALAVLGDALELSDGARELIAEAG